ncbi:hypothetical protein G9A89_022346 [Geosiphon pyriformis]|nr:hypothetical protein G9A89_022346 [Geosiphon pyriformis]
MVKLEEIAEGQEIQEEEGLSDAASNYSSDSGASEYEESILERLWALRDMIHQDTRESISNNVTRVWSYGMRSASFLGNTLWVLTTSAIILVLPLAIELEREQAIMHMENEQKALMNQQPTHAYNSSGQPQQPGRASFIPPGY